MNDAKLRRGELVTAAYILERLRTRHENVLTLTEQAKIRYAIEIIEQIVSEKGT